jgi:hypothetical protein
MPYWTSGASGLEHDGPCVGTGGRWCKGLGARAAAVRQRETIECEKDESKGRRTMEVNGNKSEVTKSLLRSSQYLQPNAFRGARQNLPNGTTFINTFFTLVRRGSAPQNRPRTDRKARPSKRQGPAMRNARICTFGPG